MNPFLDLLLYQLMTLGKIVKLLQFTFAAIVALIVIELAKIYTVQRWYGLAKWGVKNAIHDFGKAWNRLDSWILRKFYNRTS